MGCEQQVPPLRFARDDSSVLVGKLFPDASVGMTDLFWLERISEISRLRHCVDELPDSGQMMVVVFGDKI